MARYQGIERDENNAIVPGAKIYVLEIDGSTLATLTDDSGNALGNPLVSDSLGAFYFNADMGVYWLQHRVNGRLLLIETVPVGVPAYYAYPGQIVTDAQTAETAAVASAVTATSAATTAGAAATTATLQATIASAAALASHAYPNSAASAVPKGVTGTTGLTAGSGGTNGTFALAFSGGGGSGAAGTFTVAGGALASAVITANGYGYTSAPTISLAASGGLTGAALTAVVGFLELGNYAVINGDGSALDLYKNNAGTPALISSSFIPLSPSLAALVLAMSRPTYTTSFANPATTVGNNPAPAARTWILNSAVASTLPVDQMTIVLDVADTVKVYKFVVSGGNYTTGTLVATLTHPGGLHTFSAPADFAQFNLGPSEHLGFYTATAQLQYTTTNNGGSLATAGIGDNPASTAASPVAGSYFQVSVRQVTQTLMNMAAELNLRPTPFTAWQENASFILYHEHDASGYQQVKTIRKSDDKVFTLTSGAEHWTGSLTSDANTMAVTDQNEISYTVPATGGTLALLHSTTDLTGWGDSLTQYTGANPADAWLAQIAATTSRAVYNGGVAGETSTQIKTRALASTQSLRERTTIIWAGTNNPSPSSTVVADVAAIVAALPVKSKRFLVLPALNSTSSPNPSSGYTQMANCNAALAAAYPNNYYDIRGYLIAHGLADAGITPTSTDLANIAADVIPDSLRLDFLHPNAIAEGVIKTQILAQLALRGW